ncbi:nucleoside-diphosphate sugar epimerase/dehydratase [Catenovulum maritimum]|uniref:Nucleoside-diphosphate sugar epimerase n=1 Tax=Catenovulum maritimum TaxID=1513271 RepID=A0A0J8GPQ4_9ALTE|nr:nucleoside-diphosphate sugar epimerase/dehydratase [Catenovulum maritimum]KMT64752.1 nucleoside-diphosphate sugar epimerase [Catenovulum maritimum]
MSPINFLFQISRPAKRAVSVSLDIFFVIFAFASALVLRHDSLTVVSETDSWLLLFLVLPVTIGAFIRLGLYRAVIRYIGPQAALSVVIGVAVSVLSLVLASFFFHIPVPRTVPFIYAAFLLIFVGGSRFFVRALAIQSRKRGKEKVVVYGAGSSGRQLATSLMHGQEYEPVAFVDDDQSLQGNFVMGRPVYAFDDLQGLLLDRTVRRVLLAMPSLSRSNRSKIISNLEPLSVEVLSIPGSADLVSGEARIDELREVAIEDLLGREPVEPKPQLMSANIFDKVVMVSGAGGSIGSELCRQIIKYKPKMLVLYELSEFALYSIDSELRRTIEKQKLEVVIKPIMGTVQRQNRVETVMRTFKVQTVYHAAAYKHVPLVEYNIVEGVRNNVFGTYYTAEAAVNAGVETFVLISTDKAVRPTNVMGTTKRIAELSLQGLAKRQSLTTFCMVRFGNVLGSSGSVVPLFREQIKKGGPITVTHKDIIRYFMTIPEASQLVIQAGAMAKGGDVFVLDMGDPVKISDLAVKMVHLMGLEVKDAANPNGDIEIKYTGLRPGEKLYEELLIGDSVEKTTHPRIMTANEVSLSWTDMFHLIDNLDEACHNFEIEKIQKLIKEAPTGYVPSSDLCDLVWKDRPPTKDSSNVIGLHSL